MIKTYTTQWSAQRGLARFMRTNNICINNSIDYYFDNYIKSQPTFGWSSYDYFYYFDTDKIFKLSQKNLASKYKSKKKISLEFIASLSICLAFIGAVMFSLTQIIK